VEFVISKSWLEVLAWSLGRCFQAKTNRKYVLLSCELNSGQNFSSLAAVVVVVVIVVVVVVVVVAAAVAAAAVLPIHAIP